MIERISELDPDHLTPESVSRFLGWWCPRWCARVILNTGVRQGNFRKIDTDVYKFIA